MDKIKVAVINSSKEITEMLEEIFQDEGFKTCSTFTYEFKNHEANFDKYVAANKPNVIVYDIAPPYQENYFLFQHLSSRKSAENIPFILTSTNNDALNKLVGRETNAHEILGKPFDLQEIIDAVKSAHKRNYVKSQANL